MSGPILLQQVILQHAIWLSRTDLSAQELLIALAISMLLLGTLVLYLVFRR